MNTLHTLLFAVAVVASLGSIKEVIAQSYPSRPITLIVPANIGEPVDTLARILVQPMERSLSQTIQIDNIDGSDPLRFGRLARSAPDGCTFGINNRNYDVTDFRPVALLPSVPAWIVSRTRAFHEKVESVVGDSHDGANRIQDPYWNKEASHEWGSLIPTICANGWLRQSKPVIPA
jgi:tripartite-type tricarboxylate transporter receptor subunit TctC